jgi:nucleoside phosphorylase
VILVCFAVKEEAAPFRERSGSLTGVEIMLTGMGQRNAESAIRQVLASPGQKPDLVLTCGFAGGLRPGLARGTVLFAVDGDQKLESALKVAGADPAVFSFSSRVATRREEKQTLWERTKTDAVEMESQAIGALCREAGIPCATVRVILDTAEEDLPLDFNRLMTPDQRMDFGKLALRLARSPWKMGGLMRLQKQSREAAERLADVLVKAIGSRG